MRVNPQPPAAGAKQELTDADRARIDARIARFGVAEGFAHAGLIIGEDFRKVSQLYEQISAQARGRGEAMPDMETWLQQRAQERLAQGYLPTMPDGRRVQPFEAAMSEAADLVGLGRGAPALAPTERGDAGAASAADDDFAQVPAAVEGLLGQLEFGQQGRAQAGNRRATVLENSDYAIPAAVAGDAVEADATKRALAEAEGTIAAAADPLAGADLRRGDALGRRPAVDAVLDQLARERDGAKQG